jgi:hypothetical protein
MLSEPRTISLLAELIHIPVKHSFERLREVYNQISSACGYENFIRLANGARLERGQGEEGQSSTLTFLNDRLQLVEDSTVGESAVISVEETGRKLTTALKAALPTLGIPIVLVQQYTVRALATPNSYKNAAEFLGRSLFRIKEEDVAVLGRPTSIFGLRLVFPPQKSQLNNFNVRIEAYARDPRSVYLENVGMWKTPLQLGQLDQVQENLERTADFLTANVLKFLSQYDRREVEP